MDVQFANGSSLCQLTGASVHLSTLGSIVAMEIGIGVGEVRRDDRNSDTGCAVSNVSGKDAI